jgi:hypothetical protein
MSQLAKFRLKIQKARKAQREKARKDADVKTVVIKAVLPDTKKVVKKKGR